MRMPSTAELLSIWERGAEQSSIGRALLLLGAACTEESPATVAAVTIGARDAALLDLRERMFGSKFHGVAMCPVCRDMLELTFDADDVRHTAGTRSCAESSGAMHSVRIQEYELQVRLPDSRDLEQISFLPNIDDAKRLLFERCVLRAQRNGIACEKEQVPDQVVQRVEDHMEEIDPQADLQLSLTCPCCCHGWEAPFDIASFLWKEVDVCARRLLKEVHVLASAYSWRESDILAMSPWRRHAYLAMVEQ